jgi:hypothetical protein
VVPIVKPVPPAKRLRDELVPLVQAIEVNNPQLPDSNCIYDVAALMLAPILLNEIVGNADVAVKEYHTSAPGVPLQELVTVGLELVAYAKVPPVFTQDEPGVNDIAPEQASFAGGPGSIMQISKFPSVAGALPVVENTLT